MVKILTRGSVLFICLFFCRVLLNRDYLVTPCSPTNILKLREIFEFVSLQKQILQKAKCRTFIHLCKLRIFPNNGDMWKGQSRKRKCVQNNTKSNISTWPSIHLSPLHFSHVLTPKQKIFLLSKPLYFDFFHVQKLSLPWVCELPERLILGHICREAKCCSFVEWTAFCINSRDSICLCGSSQNIKIKHFLGLCFSFLYAFHMYLPMFSGR